MEGSPPLRVANLDCLAAVQEERVAQTRAQEDKVFTNLAHLRRVTRCE